MVEGTTQLSRISSTESDTVPRRKGLYSKTSLVLSETDQLVDGSALVATKLAIQTGLTLKMEKNMSSVSVRIKIRPLTVL